MKVLFLLEHIRLDHFDKQNKWKYLQTSNGQTMKKVIESVTSLSRKDYKFLYVYNQIPQPIYNNYGKVIKYDNVKLTDARPYMEQCKEQIKEMQPDIVIPTGKLGIKMLLNVSKLSSVRGVPVFNDELNTWVLPTFSIEYTNVNKNAERQVVSDLELLQRFVEQGDEAFKPKEVAYELVTDIERVREIFEKEVKNDNNDGVDITAWDLETNSLKPDRKGSKPLVLSMSWKNGQGVTIPLYKSDFNWENGQQDIDEILSLLKEWLSSKEDDKVGHNIKYDIRFLMTTQGFKTFENNQDTLVGWYLAVTQEQKESLRLSTLAYEATDMGGYDKPLEDFKVWYATKLLPTLKNILNGIEKENKSIAKKEYKVTAKDYKEWIDSKIDLTKEVELDKQYIDLGLNPEKVTKTHLLDNEEFKNVCKESKEYMSLSDKGKEYVLNISLNLTNQFKNEKNVINVVDGGNFNYDWIPLELMHPYASGDTDACRRIYCEVVKELNKQDRPKAFRLLQQDYPRLSRTLARLEHNGLYMDLPYMKENDKAYKEEMEKVTNEVRSHWAVQEFEEEKYNLYLEALKEFNNNKPKDRDSELVKYKSKYKDDGWKFKTSSGSNIGEVLYKIIGIFPPYEKDYIKEKPFNSNVKEEDLTWQDYKTDKKTIKYLLDNKAKDNTKDLLANLYYYALIKNKRNTFTKKLPTIINKDTLTIHPGYNIVGTESSRLSSSNINIQQIPAHTSDVSKFDYWHPIKRSFISRFKDGVILQYDYSALEMRIMGVYTKDEKMLEAFLEGQDFHKATASIVYDKPISEITKEERQATKAVNFGIAYGQSSSTLATNLGITAQEGEEIFNKYFLTKPKVKDSIDYVHEFVQKYGYVETMSGHRRFLADAKSTDKRKRSEALRQSYNTVIQGSGAYLTNMSLTYIDDFLQLKNLKTKVIATVHDSIVLDCPPEEVKIMAKVVKQIMENLPFDFLKVDHNNEVIQYPVESDAEIGFNYNDAVEYDEKEIAKFNSYKGYIKYNLALQKISDYMESGKLTDEQYNSAIKQVKEQKELYQQI